MTNEWDVQGKYSSKWETVYTASTLTDARKILKNYNDNEKAPHRILFKKGKMKKKKVVKRKRRKIAWGLFPGMQTPPTILKKLKENCLMLQSGQEISLDIHDANKISAALAQLGI
jgi:hypothetical protein